MVQKLVCITEMINYRRMTLECWSLLKNEKMI